jgi:hypothetical protein
MQLLWTPWKDELITLLKLTKDEAFLCSPYLDKEIVEEIIEAFEGKHLKLLTRDDRGNNEALLFLQERENQLNNVETRLTKCLHAKVYLLDEKKAIITSSNLTEAGLEKSNEIGVLIENPEFLNQLKSRLEYWWKDATDLRNVNKKHLKPLKRMPRRDSPSSRGIPSVRAIKQPWNEVIQLAKKLRLSRYIVGNYILETDGTNGKLTYDHIKDCDEDIRCKPPSSNAARMERMFDEETGWKEQGYIKQLSRRRDLERVIRFWGKHKDIIHPLGDRLIASVYSSPSSTPRKLTGKEGCTIKHLIYLVCLYNLRSKRKWVSSADWIRELNEWKRKNGSNLEKVEWLEQDEIDQLEKEKTRNGEPWLDKDNKTIGGSMVENFLIPLGLVERSKNREYRVTALGKMLVEKHIDREKR